MKRPTLSNESGSSLYPGRSYLTPSSKSPVQSYQRPVGINFNSPKNDVPKGFVFPQKPSGTNLVTAMKVEKAQPALERKNSKNSNDIYAKTSSTPTNAAATRANKVRGSSTKAASTDKSKTEQNDSKQFGGSKYSDALNLRDSLLKQAKPRNLEVSTDIQVYKTAAAVKAYTTKSKDSQERLQASSIGANGASFSGLDYTAKQYVNQSAINNLNRPEYVRTEASEDKSLTPTLKQKTALGRILANTSEKGQSATLKKTSLQDEQAALSQSSPNVLKVNNFFANAKRKELENTIAKKDNSLNMSKKDQTTLNDREELIKTLEYNMKMANKSQLDYKSTYKGFDDSKDDSKDSRNLSLATPSKEPKSSAPQKASLGSFITKVERGTVLPGKPKKDDDSSSGLAPTRPYLTLEDKPSGKATRTSSESSVNNSQSTTNTDTKTITFGKNKLNQQALASSSQEVVKAKGKSSEPPSPLPRGVRRSTDEVNGADSYTYYVTDLERHHRNWNEADYFCQIYKEHFIQTFQALTFCKYLRPVDPRVLNQKKVFLPKRATHKDKKTIIFDLDETLIHCNESAEIESDVVLPIRFPTGELIEAGINIRPYPIELLEELHEDFEIIVFTASHSCYANVVLDYLDPEGKYIHHRLFREHCMPTEQGVYIKDLRILGDRNLQDCVLIDNAAYSYGYQLDNGIPIIPFYHNKRDEELKHLAPYLKSFATVKDCREVNKRTFKLHTYTMFDTLDKVINKVILAN